jgi:hypothetical protein
MLVALIVSLIVIGVAALVGVLGHLMEKSGEPPVHEPERDGA